MLTVLAAILFNHLKANVDSVLKKYGEGNFPPPESVYTISNDIGMGNLHMVQKVFEGPFEVCLSPAVNEGQRIDSRSSTSFSRPPRQKSP